AMIEKTPAARDQKKVRADTGRARRLRRRPSDVFRGHQRPPRYCHITHSSTAISATAQGIFGAALRLINSSVPHMNCPRNKMMYANSPAHKTLSAFLAKIMVALQRRCCYGIPAGACRKRMEIGNGFKERTIAGTALLAAGLSAAARHQSAGLCCLAFQDGGPA